MESVLEEIEFLALSENRVEVLSLVADAPRTRRELVDSTGASQPTLGRILSDFEERAWVRREGSEYVATATGRLVAEGFGALVDIFETEAKLRDVVRWLPAETLRFDLRRLTDATITTPSQTKPNAPVQRVLALLRDADEVRIFSHAFNEQSLDVVRERTVADEQVFQGVFSRRAIDAIADDSQLRERLHALVDSAGAEIRIADEDIPLAVTIADETVHLFLRDHTGILRASVDVADPEVLAWARDKHERYWRNATPLDDVDSV